MAYAAAGGGIAQASGEAHAKKLFNTLRELVEQVEWRNARDDHGHPLKRPQSASRRTRHR
jgi:hypothetical protein